MANKSVGLLKKAGLPVAGVAAVLLLSGCASILPESLTSEQVAQVAALDKEKNANDVPALQGALTLEEAIARALKYNLEHRTRMLEQTYSVAQLEESRFDLLPQLNLGADYTNRSEPNLRRNESLSGGGVFDPSTVSTAQEHTVSQLGLTWSLLDYGVSYYNAKQQANQTLIATERRRKAMHQLTQKVQGTYWRAMAAQKLRAEVRKTIREADKALEDAVQVEKERIKTPMESLSYQRSLLENLRTLEAVEDELKVAKLELNALINLPVASDYALVEPEGAAKLAALQLSLGQMETLAIANNADLREENYNVDNAVLETRKSMVKLFPGIKFSYGLKHDNDNFLVEESWQDASLSVNANLINLFSYGAVKARAESLEVLSEQRRMAMQMNLLAQVHISAQQFDSSRQQFDRADNIWRVDDRMLQITLAAQDAQTQSGLNLIASKTTTILSLLRRYQALADMHAASGQVQATLGLEPQVASLDLIGLSELTMKVKEAQENWQMIEAPAAAVEAEVPAKLELNDALRGELNAELDSWAADWAAKDLTAYLSHYAADFVPANGMALADWKVQRAERLAQPSRISVKLKYQDYQLVSEDSVAVQVKQRYRSDRFGDNTTKVFVLQRQDDGWKIRSEEVR
ncbi:TolC family protein [Amphritea balenae]|uniref:TolC family protein n=1 Tax=Amphritea balenae TaxID=452629 RepID=A0A3P1SPW0_9GAMM|nr:TolC family protein [Amphritea balenae]RRC99153.1 TolC family protein [Amphritea balenae]GGK73537.1 hypothetical protein GCM10007941_24440 [Amphritea balenae]